MRLAIKGNKNKKFDTKVSSFISKINQYIRSMGIPNEYMEELLKQLIVLAEPMEEVDGITCSIIYVGEVSSYDFLPREHVEGDVAAFIYPNGKVDIARNLRIEYDIVIKTEKAENFKTYMDMLLDWVSTLLEDFKIIALE